MEDQVGTMLADHDPATANPSGRIPLNVKNLPYTTVWIDACDIEVEAKKIGALPTGEQGGKPLYTVPFIYDPATRTALSDSQNIVAYLEAQYPASPTLFPPRTRALQAAFTEGARAAAAHLFPRQCSDPSAALQDHLPALAGVGAGDGQAGRYNN
jgi:hypothetical protein